MKSPPPHTRRWELTPAAAADYLRSRGTIAGDATASELAGGISNIVIRVDAAEGGYVVKQSLDVLRVAQDWRFDPARIFTERRCMQALGTLLPAGTVPRVVDHDDERFAFTMTLVPDSATVWKSDLLSGEVRSTVAARAGELLGLLQAHSPDDPELAHAFSNQMPLEQGRIEPYHLATAAAHPDLAVRIERDVEHLRTDRRTLVLGDFSPKNILVRDDELVLLDFEVAHWGDPAFDPAFLMTHLTLKGIHRCADADAYLSARDEFWTAYIGFGGLAAESRVAAEIAVLLLCRVDGKSPAEYLDDRERSYVRRAARRLIGAESLTLDDVDEVVRQWQKENR